MLSGSRTFPGAPIQEKFVALEQRDQNTRRVRYPELTQSV